MIVFRSILKEVAVSLGMWTGLLMVLFCALAFLRASDVILGSAVDLLDIGRLFAALMPQFVVQSLPISFLLALLLGFGRLSEDNELKALQAAGYSPLQFIGAPLVLGTAVTLALALLAFTVQPWGARQLRTIVVGVIEKNVIGDVKARTFYEGIMGMTLYAEEVPQSGPWKNILLFTDYNVEGQWLSLAQEGQVVPSTQTAGVIEFQLKNGTSHRVAASGVEYSVAQFARARLLGGVGEAVSRTNTFHYSREEMTPADLWRSVEEKRAAKEVSLPTEVSFHWRIGQLLMPLAFTFIGTALSLLKRAQGRSFAVMMTLSCYVIYYVAGRMLTQLGERGAVSPWIVGQLVNVSFLALGACGIALSIRRGVA
jgi:lipopolysaccharide export system permease protein